MTHDDTHRRVRTDFNDEDEMIRARKQKRTADHDKTIAMHAQLMKTVRGHDQTKDRPTRQIDDRRWTHHDHHDESPL